MNRIVDKLPIGMPARAHDTSSAATGFTPDTPSGRLSSLSIVLPCYNEEANVERVVAEAVSVARTICDEFEVLIINDGSRDRTGTVADGLAARHPCIRVFHHTQNRGYGGALQRGFRESAKDWVFYTDSDGQFDLHELPRLIARLDQYDIVSAYRQGRQDSMLRRFSGTAWTALMRALFGLRIRDIDCAFKVYPRELFRRIDMVSQGALIDTEVLVKASDLGYRIGQIGVSHYARTFGASTGGNVRVIARAFRELIRFRRRYRRPLRRSTRCDDAISFVRTS